MTTGRHRAAAPLVQIVESLPFLVPALKLSDAIPFPGISGEGADNDTGHRAHQRRCR